jgi:hypothetical protein
MKSARKVLLAICCLAMTAGAAWAADYSKMTNEELSAKRGTMFNASQEEWNDFHTEWWKRLSQMTPAERQQYMGPGMGRGMGKGSGMGKGKGMGGGCWCPCWSGPGPAAQNPAAKSAAPAKAK